MSAYDKNLIQRKIIIHMMKQGGFYDRIMDAGPELNRVKQFLQIMEGKQPPLEGKLFQAPTFLPIFPGLNAKPFHQHEHDEVAAYLEKAINIIKTEVLQFKNQRLSSDNLQAALTWKINPLWYLGVNLSFLNKDLPNTKKIIDNLPNTAIKFPLAESIISWLDPQAHLPAHCSTDGLRLRYSLGVVVEDFCQLRVGALTQTWQEGKCMLFEDCFEHEAWNGNKDRAVLIADTWHPDLTLPERAAIAAGFRKREVREVLYRYRPIAAMQKIIHAKFQQEERELSNEYWDPTVIITVPSLADIDDWKNISVTFTNA